MNKKLKDHVVEGSQIEFKQKLDELVIKARIINQWINENVQRSEKSVILMNLLTSISDYLQVTRDSLNLHISIIAISTRSIYELNVRIRSVLLNDEELKKWVSEAVTDKVQALEGILTLGHESENTHERAILRQEIARIQGLITKYGMPVIKNPENTGNLAKLVGLDAEHKALFKLFSKLVHPSSYMVNDHQNAASIDTQKILQIHAQLYAYDSITRICEALNVPNHISKQCSII